VFYRHDACRSKQLLWVVVDQLSGDQYLLITTLLTSLTTLEKPLMNR
jgi:hypothetical protein